MKSNGYWHRHMLVQLLCDEWRFRYETKNILQHNGHITNVLYALANVRTTH